MARVLGVDYGSKRIGVAISDPEQIIATPMEVIPAVGSPNQDALNIAELARRHEVAEFVVGLPLTMGGSEGKQARITRAMGQELAQASSLPVHFYDERFSTFAANSALREAELDRRQRGAHLDKVAACIVLQAFLDYRRRQPTSEGQGPGGGSAPSADSNDVDPPAGNS